MDDIVMAVMVAITLLVLLPACYLDLRYRQVPNLFWWILGIAGLAFLFYWTLDGREFQLWYALLMAGTVLILLDMLVFEIRNNTVFVILYVVTALCFIIPCVICFDVVSKSYFLIGVSFAIIMVLYMTGIIKGGADVKCLITLAFMFPTCPTFYGFPLIHVPSSLEYAFPFTIAVLFHAALFALAYLFVIVLRKLWRKTDPVRMVNISCYTMSIAEARRSHVWAKQDVKDGMVVNVNYIPDEGVYDRLEAAGAKTVWVTPIIPFIIPITIAVVFVLFVGNLLFIPFNL